MFVMYAGIVHVQCYRVWYVETGYVNTILGKKQKYNMPFLRGTSPILGTQDLPGRFKEWKACLVEIGQTAHKLETNVRANFHMAENLANQFMENGGRNMPTLIFLWLSVAFRHNTETNSST